MAASIFPPVFEGELVAEGEIQGQTQGQIHGDGEGNKSGLAPPSRPGSSMSSSTAGGGGAQAVTVTIDDGSVVVIRRLSCGVLFISTGGGGAQEQRQTQADGEGTADGGESSTAESHTAAVSNEASGGGLSKADVLVLRRRVEELARLLDGQLSALYVPEDGVGIFSAPASRFYGRVAPWRSG